MKEERSKAKIWNLSLKSWKERALNDKKIPNPSYIWVSNVLKKLKIEIIFTNRETNTELILTENNEISGQKTKWIRS